MNFKRKFRLSTFRSFSFICILFIILYCLCRIYINKFHSHSTDIFPPTKIIFDGVVDLNIITNESFRCVKTKQLLDKYSTTVCVHKPEKDYDISGTIISSGIWEQSLVTRLVNILSTYSQFAFFDIGANVGVYTMYAASLGCSNVISIECFQPNIERIRRAIQMEHVEQRVVLVSRALYRISNAYFSLRTNIHNNIGSQRLNHEVLKNEDDPFVVKTIRFDDLLPIVIERNIREAIIKIDIETSEHFLCITGERMFEKINIPFIMMEWAVIKTITTRADLINEFFISRHYIPFDPDCKPQTETNYQLWNSQDIYWIKQNYTYLCKL